MEMNKTIHSRLKSLVSSLTFWVAALLIAALSGGLSSVRVGGSAWEAMPLVTVLAVTAVVGITWQSRAAPEGGCRLPWRPTPNGRSGNSGAGLSAE